MTNPSPTQTRSSIQRSWKSTLTSIIIALVSAAVSAALFMTIVGGPVTIGIALIPAVVALIFVFMAISGAGECPCPACGKPLDGLTTGSNDGKLCPHCHRYFEGKNAQLWATDEMRIADHPQFSSPLPDSFTFPDACCVCAQPATKKQKIQLTTTNASSAVTQSTIGLTTTTRTSVEVPHCDQHKDGAMLTGTQSKTHIKFRSYPYLRAFCELNNTTPG